jgi:pyruvate kinase
MVDEQAMTLQTEPILKTKIVCTIGPASWDTTTLTALCEAGMDVVRLNMSHSTPDEVRAAARAVRKCAAALGRPVALLVDLQGPKIRLGKLSGSVSLNVGERVILAPAESADAGQLPVTYARLAEDLRSQGR